MVEINIEVDDVYGLDSYIDEEVSRQLSNMSWSDAIDQLHGDIARKMLNPCKDGAEDMAKMVRGFWEHTNLPMKVRAAAREFVQNSEFELELRYYLSRWMDSVRKMVVEELDNRSLRTKIRRFLRQRRASIRFGFRSWIQSMANMPLETWTLLR